MESTERDREDKLKKANETTTISNGTRTLTAQIWLWLIEQKTKNSVLMWLASRQPNSSPVLWTSIFSTYYHWVQWKANVWRGANTCWPMTWDDSFYVTHSTNCSTHVPWMLRAESVTWYWTEKNWFFWPFTSCILFFFLMLDPNFTEFKLRILFACVL